MAVSLDILGISWLCMTPVLVGLGFRMHSRGKCSCPVQVEEELSEVQPLIDAAKKAVGNIKKDNIAEIRSLKMPPDAIRDVLEGVLMILGQQDTSWNNMKTFLGKSSVKDDIINYDAHRITPEIRARVGRGLSCLLLKVDWSMTRTFSKSPPTPSYLQAFAVPMVHSCSFFLVHPPHLEFVVLSIACRLISY